MTTKTLPESLTIKLEFEITLDEVEEICLENDEKVTFQKMLDVLRDYAFSHIDDDAYNMVQGADVYDQNGDKVC
jgi:hypothetical protein